MLDEASGDYRFFWPTKKELFTEENSEDIRRVLNDKIVSLTAVQGPAGAAAAATASQVALAAIDKRESGKDQR